MITTLHPSQRQSLADLARGMRASQDLLVEVGSKSLNEQAALLCYQLADHRGELAIQLDPHGHHRNHDGTATPLKDAHVRLRATVKRGDTCELLSELIRAEDQLLDYCRAAYYATDDGPQATVLRGQFRDLCIDRKKLVELRRDLASD